MDIEINFQHITGRFLSKAQKTTLTLSPLQQWAQATSRLDEKATV